MAKVVINIYNGIIEEVLADQEGLEVLLLEQDKYADPENLYLVDGDKVTIRGYEAEHDPLAVENLYKNVEQAKREKKNATDSRNTS